VLGPEQLVSWVHIAALELSRGKSAAELSVLGSVFAQMGDTLATMSAQKALMEEKENR
jgi:hypothetical protein